MFVFASARKTTVFDNGMEADFATMIEIFYREACIARLFLLFVGRTSKILSSSQIFRQWASHLGRQPFSNRRSSDFERLKFRIQTARFSFPVWLSKAPEESVDGEWLPIVYDFESPWKFGKSVKLAASFEATWLFWPNFTEIS